MTAPSADIIEDPAVNCNGMLDMFAAQVRAMDLVIFIDNSTVYYAGALCVPTFMMLNKEIPDTNLWPMSASRSSINGSTSLMQQRLEAVITLAQENYAAL